MGLIRIAILLALTWVVVRLYARYKLPPKRSAESDGGRRKMVKCRICSVYLPQDDAISDDDRTYCCVAHQREGSDR